MKQRVEQARLVPGDKCREGPIVALQRLIDELGILSLILDFDLEKEAFSRISDSIHQIVPPETALICAGASTIL